MTNQEKMKLVNSKGVGARCAYFPIMGNNGIVIFQNGKRTETASESFLSNSGYPVVFLKGIRGYVSVEHVVFGLNLVEKNSPIYDTDFDHSW